MSEESPILKPAARHRRPAARLAALAVLCWAGPAAATAHASLGVSATVVPACIVSTRPQTASADRIALACSNLGQGSASISRAGDSSLLPVPERQAAPATKTGGPSSQAGISYITITY